MTVSHLPGTAAAIGKLSLAISYDDGVTWRRPGLDRDGDAWRTALKASKSAGFVTLRGTARGTARDSADNSVSRTITRAFGLR
ncbi:hypothetical protein ACWD6R_31375 [Streptomyces sp. NPDC005151]